ncbi:MAG: hypothetical protein V4563_17890 [Pseudomonadota bacterium]
MSKDNKGHGSEKGRKKTQVALKAGTPIGYTVTDVGSGGKKTVVKQGNYYATGQHYSKR